MDSNPDPGLPAGLAFSASSLQDYLDCPRRFELRYLQQAAWPAVQSEPALEAERAMRLGQRFHRLVQQYWMGVPAARLAEGLHGEELTGWWASFIHYVETNRPAEGRRVYPEARLQLPLGRQRLVAQYDLALAGDDGRLLIYDWKTARRRPP
ncbi:MAG: PD-(D/E)XK nuclease family protein, partial [Chloroflexota bacterium]